MNKKAAAAGLGALLLTRLLAASENPVFSISLKGGYGLPSSKTLNEGIIERANRSLEEFRDFLSSFGFDGSLTTGPNFSGSFLLGAELQLRLFEGFHLAATADILQDESQARLSGTCRTMYDGTQSEVKQENAFKVKCFRAAATLRYYFPVGKMRIYLGSGAGYYRARLNFLETSSQTINGIVLSWPFLTDAQARKILPHINAGLELPVFRWLRIGADAQYVLGIIRGFELSDDSQRHPHVGKTLTYLDGQGQEKEVVWELNGPQLALLLRLAF